MNKRRHTKLVREGAYVAEVEIEVIDSEVEVIDSEGGWAPYISPADAGRLDHIREAYDEAMFLRRLVSDESSA